MLNKEKFKEKLGRMIPNPLRLALKMFGLVWFFLVLQVVLKLTFNYWQPYVIPTEQLENVGKFIDNHRWLQVILNGIFYVFNSVIMILCAIRQWFFKTKKQFAIVLLLSIVCYIVSITYPKIIFTGIFLTIILPIIINKKSWIWAILTFVLSNIFLFISLILEGFTIANNMNYIVGTFLQNDYYIMLILNYILFNIIRIKKEGK